MATRILAIWVLEAALLVAGITQAAFAQTGIPTSSLLAPPASSARLPDLPLVTRPILDEDARPQPIGSFPDALTNAYWSHPSLLAERARLRSVSYRLPQARAAFGPNLYVEGSYGFLRTDSEQLTGSWSAREGWTSTASAILSQPLFTFGHSAANEREAQAAIAFQRATLRAREMAILFDAIRAYVAVLRDRQAVSIVADDLALLEREYDDNLARFERREVTSTDVQQIETRLEQSRAQAISARSTVASSEAIFLSAVGTLPADELAPPDRLAMPVNSLEEAHTFAELHNPLLRAAFERERISRAQADVTRAGHLPRVDLRGRAEYGTVSPYSDALRQSTLRGEVVVSMPLFQSGFGRAQLGEAVAANDSDWRLIDAALRENRAEVTAAWNEWVAQTSSIDRLSAAASAARQALDGALLQERAGLRSTLDVLQLARELLVVRSSYNAATANAYVAQVRVLVAIGALDYGDLYPDATTFNPAADYRGGDGYGPIPLISPLLRALDAIPMGDSQVRPSRDLPTP